MHNVRADNDSFRCANGCDGEGGNGSPSSSGWSFTRTFNSPATIPYYCEIHGAPGGFGMTGTITVENASVPGTLAFAAASYSVAEGTASKTIQVARSGGSDGAVSVQYATANGSATAGADYTATSGTLSWADGESGPKSFSVSIVNDSLVESSETVNLSISSPTGGATLGSPASSVLTITDNDNADAPGTLHRVVGRGIEGARIFRPSLPD